MFGVDLGGLARAEAEGRLRDRLAPFEAAAVTYTWEGQTWTATASDLGVAIDYEATLDAAWRRGRFGGLIDRYATLLDRSSSPTLTPIALVLDEAKLDAYLAALDREIARSPRDARLVVAGLDVVVVPELVGLRLDTGAARRLTRDAIQRATPGEVALPALPIPPHRSAADLAVARQAVATFLSGPVAVTGDGRTWTVSPADLASAVALPADPARQTPGLDPVLLRGPLAPIAAEVNRPPHDATVAWDKGLYALSEGEAGVTVDLDRLARRVVEAAATDARSVALPLIATPPAIDAADLGALRITAPLAEGSSSFAGSSPARATNVAVAVEHVSQALVPPGGTFSFNGALGRITPEHGYVEGNVIAGDWFASDLGGGVCQVSTTVFRAALLAGLPFVEWNPHTFRLDFYELDGWPAGMDAAIYQPNTPDEWDLDLAFVNPTDGWLLLQARIEGETLIAALYGTPTGYEVELSTPAFGEPIPPPESIERPSPDLPVEARELVQVARPGVVATVTRRVTREAGEVLTDDFVSPYQPQAEVWLVGTDEA